MLKRIKEGVEVLSGVLMIAVACAVLWRMAQPATRATASASSRPAPAAAPLPAEPLALDGAVLRGQPTAKVAIIGFSDFQCPYCARFATETFPQLDRDFLSTGKAVFAFRHMPLESIHPQAAKAAEAAECAKEQGRFWEMHDLLFQNPRTIDQAQIRRHAQSIPVALPAFDECMGGRLELKVRSDMVRAKAVGITGTPTFLIGRAQPDGTFKIAERLVGAQPLSAFSSAIERLLADQPK